MSEFSGLGAREKKYREDRHKFSHALGHDPDMPKDAGEAPTVREVVVDRKKPLVKVFLVTGRKFFGNAYTLSSLPTGDKEVVDMVFFRVPGGTDHVGILEEYRKRKLVSDPRAQAQVNCDNPLFADKWPNVTFWLGPKGEPCFTKFVTDLQPKEKRLVLNGIVFTTWSPVWLFGGVTK